MLSSKNLNEAVLKIGGKRQSAFVVMTTKDFGFARFYDAKELVYSRPGTPMYQHPKVILHQPYTANITDIWAMGITFYVLLTGKVLFHDVRTQVKEFSRNFLM